MLKFGTSGIRDITSKLLKNHVAKEIAQTLNGINKAGSENTIISQTTRLPIVNVSLLPKYQTTKVLEIEQIPSCLNNTEKELIGMSMYKAAGEGKLKQIRKWLCTDYPEKEEFINSLFYNRDLEEINALARQAKYKKISAVRKFKQKFSFLNNQK